MTVRRTHLSCIWFLNVVLDCYGTSRLVFPSALILLLHSLCALFDPAQIELIFLRKLTSTDRRCLVVEADEFG